MDDSKFLSGEFVTTDLTNSGSLVPIRQSRRCANERSADSGALIPFRPQQDYALLTPKTPTEFVPDIGWWSMVGGFVTVGLVGAGVGLSAILKYQIVVPAPATIRPVGELGLVQSTIEGSVLKILVRENQTVRRGEPIATVQDLRLASKLQTKYSQIKSDIQKGRQQAIGIDAQIRSLDLQVIAEREQSSRSIAGIQAELSRTQRDYRDKKITTQAEVAEAQANLETAEKDRAAAEIELQVAQANLRSIQAGHSAAIAKLNRYQTYSGAISTNQLEEAQATAKQQEHAIAAQQATIRKQQQIVARLSATVRANTARRQRSQAALDPSGAESNVISAKIASERARGRITSHRLQQERDKLGQQRVEIANQIATNEGELAQTARELQPTKILAPISGTIQELNLRNPDQVLHPGDRITQIVPQAAPLVIKALVAPSDIDNVKVGQLANMRVSACPYPDRGILAGKVTHVAADAKQLEQSSGGKNSAKQSQIAGNYEVTIAPDSLKLGNGANQCQIRSGMEGKVEIISKEETLLQFALRKARLLVNP